MKSSVSRILLLAGMTLAALAPAWAQEAVAKIKGTEEGSPFEGTLKFKEVKEGIRVSGRLKGVPPGKHAFHVHENGDCGNKGENAGPHYNPYNKPHGNALLHGPKEAHAGDFGNIEVKVNEKGEAKVDFVLPGARLDKAPVTFIGRAIVLHEKPDDFSQPSGNAGGRLACGLIEKAH